jgi:general secretion pathway protein D
MSVKLSAKTTAVGQMALLAIAVLIAIPTSLSAQSDQSDEAPDGPRSTIEYGSGEFVRPSGLTGDRANERLPNGGFSIVYRDAEVATVVNQVLGEYLRVDYTVAPDVSGQVTLRMEDVRTRGEALQNLRDAFEPLNISLVDRGDFIAVIRGGRSGQTGSTVVLTPGQAAPPGAGVAIIRLSYGQPSELSALLAALVPDARISQADDLRRIFVVQGEASALTSASEALSLIDVDWMEEISTGIIPIEHARATDIAGEVRSVLGPYAESVEIIPIERINSVVVFAPTPAGLQIAQRWVRQLDAPRRQASSPGQLVYTVQHADPVELVQSIQRLLGFGRWGSVGGGYSTDSPRYDTPDQNRTMGTRGGSRGGYGQGSEDLQISAAPNQNMIIARGTDERIAEVRELLELLDRPRSQVMIEAAIIAVTLHDEFNFGVNWAGLANEHVSLTLADNSGGDVTSRFPGLSATYLNADIEAALSLLSSVTEVEVISRPHVLALHNESAELQIGDQVPIITQSAVSVSDPGAPIVNQTAYRDTGVILTVTPQVRAGGVVEIDIVQEVSAVSQLSLSDVNSPTISQRRISSTLLIPSGQAVALGGLISTTRSQGETGVPVLRSAPLLGRLFRSETNSVDRTELVVILTPTIVVDPMTLSDAMLQLPAALVRLRDRLEEE